MFISKKISAVVSFDFLLEKIEEYENFIVVPLDFK